MDHINGQNDSSGETYFFGNGYTLVKLSKNEWGMIYDFTNTRPKWIYKLQFPNSATIFNITGQRFDTTDNRPVFVLFTVSAQPDPLVTAPHSYAIEYKINSPQSDKECEGILTKNQVACTPWYIDPLLYLHDFVTLRLNFIHIDMNGPNGASFYPLLPGLKSYVERGPTVTLIGADGKVTVPRRILKLRSEALEGMFNHNLKEKQTNQIEMADFDCKTLTAFKNFLLTGKITDGEETALGLILLGDKYDIQGMKSAAENFVKDNIVEMDMDDVFDVLSRVCRESLYHAVVKNWIKEKKHAD